jgi:hypothetical protein
MKNNQTIVPQPSETANSIVPVTNEEQLNLLLSEYLTKYTTDTLKKAIQLAPFKQDRLYEYKISNEAIEKILHYPNLRKEIIILDEETNSFYSGTVNQKNQRHGSGLYMKSNGERYEGFWENDMLKYGLYINEKGEIYEGSFENWKLQGEGRLLKADKQYKGSFFYGVRNGFGVETSEVEEYQGTFKNDKKDGQGKLEFKKSNNTYVGDFKEGKMTGKCEFLWANGDRYLGSIVNGVFDGSGKYSWSDGMEYEGNYDKGVRRGLGIFKWKDGRIYKGEFENNLPHGNGVIIQNGIERPVKSNMGSTINANFDMNKEDKMNTGKNLNQQDSLNKKDDRLEVKS